MKAAGVVLVGSSGSTTIGRRTMKSLPLPEAGAVRLDGAAVQLDQPARQRQADAQAGAGARPGSQSTCTNISNTLASMSGAMPMPLSAHATTGLPSSTPRRQADAPAAVVYLAALLSRFDRTCASRVASPSRNDRPVRQVDHQFVAVQLDVRGARLRARR